MAKKKTYEPETIEEMDLPELVQWEQVLDRPQTLADLDSTASTELQTAIGAIQGLGDLAYENLVTELLIADAAITNAKIAVNAIQGDVIAAAAITATKISDGAIETGKLAANAVTAAKIAAGTITANEIAASTITANKMNVSTLSAITANLGTITAGSISAVTISGSTITGSTLSTATSGQRVVLFSTLASYYNSSSTLVCSTYASGTSFWIKGEQSSTDIWLDAGASGVTAFLFGGTIRAIFDYGARIFYPTTGIDLGGAGFNWRDLYHNGEEVYQGMTQPVIYHGTVSGTSIFDDNNVPWSVSNGSTGIYVVTHNFGHQDYTVQVTPQASTVKNITVSSHGSNSFTVRVANLSDVLENNDFYFTVCEYPQ